MTINPIVTHLSPICVSPTIVTRELHSFVLDLTQRGFNISRRAVSHPGRISRSFIILCASDTGRFVENLLREDSREAREQNAPLRASRFKCFSWQQSRNRIVKIIE